MKRKRSFYVRFLRSVITISRSHASRWNIYDISLCEIANNEYRNILFCVHFASNKRKAKIVRKTTTSMERNDIQGLPQLFTQSSDDEVPCPPVWYSDQFRWSVVQRSHRLTCVRETIPTLMRVGRRLIVALLMPPSVFRLIQIEFFVWEITRAYQLLDSESIDEYILRSRDIPRSMRPSIDRERWTSLDLSWFHPVPIRWCEDESLLLTDRVRMRRTTDRSTNRWAMMMALSPDKEK